MRRRAGLAIAAVACATAQAEVPLSLAETGHATAPITLAGLGTHDFVFDTGAEGSAVYAAFADRWKLPAGKPDTLIGQTGEADLPTVRLPTVMLDGVRRDAVAAVRLPPRGDGVALAGIVGLDVFGGAMVDFDWPRRRLALLRPGSRIAGVTEAAAVTAERLPSGLLAVPVRIGGVEAFAVIDTGARKTRINSALGKALSIDLAALPVGETIRGATNVALETRSATLDGVTLGAVRLAHAPALVGDLPVFATFGVADRPAIILGLDWLTTVRMVIDMPTARVWFKEANA